MQKARRNLSILMLPWLAHGHISPFLELSKKLTARNFHIYFCSTPINIVSIKPKLCEKYSQSIELVELPLPELPELPPRYHTTNGLPPHLMSSLKKAFDLASPNFSNILKDLNPDFLIYDFLQPWAPSQASFQNIPAIEFFCTSATMVSFYLHLMKNPGEKFPFLEIYIRDYEILKFRNVFESSSNNIKDADRFKLCSDLSSDIILIKTFTEIERKYMDYLSSLVGKKIVPVEVMKWLNRKDKSSVVFVSFGSEYFLSNNEIEEIAHGLELSEVNFIWVIRFPVGEKVKIEEALPNEFLKRVGERGMVMEGWAPQGAILKSDRVGGFVSHCGWSSVMDSMKFGVPIISMPMHLDQPINARLVEDIGVGLEVKRDKNGEIQKEELANVIRKVVIEKSGESLRKKVREMREKVEKKGDEEMDEVVKELMQLCTKKKLMFM
ncbi:hypothetical protein UlMin_026140 [Ulmus minor]